MRNTEKEVLAELLQWFRRILNKNPPKIDEAFEMIDRMEKKLKEQDRWLES
jgi:hypothetical protein